MSLFTVPGGQPQSTCVVQAVVQMPAFAQYPSGIDSQSESSEQLWPTVSGSPEVLPPRPRVPVPPEPPLPALDPPEPALDPPKPLAPPLPALEPPVPPPDAPAAPPRPEAPELPPLPEAPPWPDVLPGASSSSSNGILPSL